MELVIRKKDGLICPVKNSDMPLFRHCSNDSIAVTEKFYNEFVQPLLFTHVAAGISIVSEE